jgi:Holliday junction DNA helicase RuvA
MIGYVQGEIVFLDITQVILDVGGIGYEIRISLNTYAHLKGLSKVRLHTFLQIREDAHVLFGFYNLEEKILFTQLVSVSGIGPSTAMMVLSSMEVNDIENAIASGDVITLKRIKGIGQKTAERIILELKDKIRKGKGYDRDAGNNVLAHQTVRNEALAALITLGIQKSAAEKILQAIILKHGKDIALEELIKLALKSA